MQRGGVEAARLRVDRVSGARLSAIRPLSSARPISLLRQRAPHPLHHQFRHQPRGRDPRNVSSMKPLGRSRSPLAATKYSRRELTLLAANRALPAHILGWTDQIPHLLMTHHVVISEAGGATTQEAIAARCPMIVNQIVPDKKRATTELAPPHRRRRSRRNARCRPCHSPLRFRGSRSNLAPMARRPRSHCPQRRRPRHRPTTAKRLRNIERQTRIED